VATNEQGGFLDDNLVDAVLLDIDHSPQHWLNQTNQSFYTVESLNAVAYKIKSGGVFCLWSNDRPDDKFVDLLDQVFVSTQAHVVRFDNPYSANA